MPTRVERIRGCLLGGAIGDALGAAVEFDSLDDIRSRFGPRGLRDYAVAYGRRGAITDDTQMTLFTVEGLTRASVRGRSRGICHIPSIVEHAYLRWLHTQGVPWPNAGGRFAARHPEPDGWLVQEPALHDQRAPGNTCLSALLRVADGGEQGSPEYPPNDSKGCGGVMRAAPVGFLTTGLARVFVLGCQIAALTHGHPSGYLPAGVLAAAVAGLLQGDTVADALARARAELQGWAGAEETLAALDAAHQLASRGAPTPEDIESLGAGWTGEEALAIAACVALAFDDRDALGEGLLVAVNHSGDSDSTGSICGNLLGARWGAAALPVHWLDELEAREVIEALADDAARELGDDRPTTSDGDVPAEWRDRCPPW